ncbi:uncharacterized protein LOC116774919 isoform X1 [Danaus plexippus]|uniref:uncharacterized protein LOC116774919 isoform X1 n=1 Tax=Danaus plexippus TaxID=13037 RepID=UPI002AB17267|nr:uncharacterized protein LOC116774919 isoform X1 [Danaus plexippus]
MYSMLILLYDILIIASAMRSDDQTYCTLRYRRLCMGKGSHVACQFPLAGAGASCSNYTKIKFTNVLKHFVTSYINRRRQRIASGSERVRGGAPLPRPEVWDKELAFLAQRLADQCNFVHDDCRATVRYPYAGQSVGEVHWRGTEELSLQRAIRRVLDAWWGERRRVQPEQLITPFRLTNKGSVWGHFSQLAVWSLRAVGCGAVIHGWDYTRLLLVCDFSHTNMLGQRTISPGPLAPCPIHTVRKQRSPYPLLCAPIKRSLDTENEENDLNNDYQNTPDYDGIRDTEITKRYSMNTYKYDETTKNNMLSIPRRYTWLKHSEISDQKTSDLLKHRIKQMKLWNSVRTSMNLRKYNRWESWPTRADMREDQENKGEAKLFRAHKKYNAHKDNFRFSEHSRRVTTEAGYQSLQEFTSRHRWKQTRIRQMRPGAKALLNKPLGKLPQKPSIASLMIDQDDVEQLYRDTGFHLYLKKQTGIE